jgi:putative transposase
MAYWRLYYHFVWTTQDRRPFITADIEPSLYRWLYNEANNLHCPFFYIGGTANHIHVLTAVRPAISPSEFVKQLKGSSSRFISLTSLRKGNSAWEG